MKTKWKCTLAFAVFLNITSVIIYTVIHYSFKAGTNIRNFRYVTIETENTKAFNSTPTVITKSEIINEIPCTESPLPLELLHEGTWLPVGNDRNAFVFSAYFVEKDKREIVIIGFKTRHEALYYCRIWYAMNENGSFIAEESPARLTVLPEGHGLRFSVVLFFCSVSSSLPPKYVSLLSKRCDAPLNLQSVHHSVNSKTERRNFTVCLSPLNCRYSRVFEFVEWIELNRILGAEKFIIYDYSSADNIARVLDFYSQRGLAEVIQWRLPMVMENKPIEVHYFGQVAALNDCLYRNKNQSEFIVSLDLDEFIIPHSENITSWHEMLKQLKENSTTYIFRNTFFKKEWEIADTEILNKTEVDRYQLVTLQKLQREKKIFTYGSRSKYFTRPSDVSNVMIHTVICISRVLVPTEIALVHHYRHWDTKNDPSDVKITDKTVPEKFGQDLIMKVQDVWFELDKNEAHIRVNQTVNDTECEMKHGK